MTGCLVLHALAILSVMLNSLAWIYKVILIALLLMSLWDCLKQDIGRKDFSVRFNPLLGWEIARSGNDFCAATLLKSTVITPYLIILHFKMLDNRKHAALIVKDAMTKNEYRQLLVKLKVSGIYKG